MKRIILVSLILSLFLSAGVLRADQVICKNGSASPAVLDFGTVVVGSSKTLTATVTNNNSVSTYFFQSSSGKLILSDDKKIIFQGKSFSFQVTLPSNLPIPNFSDQVVILANARVLVDGKFFEQKQQIEECRIPVQAIIVSPVKIDKGSLDFGTVTQGQSVPPQSFKLSAAEAVAFSVSADPSNEPVTITPKTGTLSAGGSVNISVTLNTQNVPDLTGRGRIIVESLPGTLNVINPLVKFSNTVALFFSIVAAAAPPPPPPPGTPDLTFSGAISITPVSGQGNNKTVTVNLTVQNLGTADSLQCSGEVFLDDVSKKSFTIPPIVQGETSRQLQVSFQTNSTGTHTVTVKLDSLSQVSESNETNNVATSGVFL